MNQDNMLEEIQCRLFLRSIYVLIAPVILTLAMLACGTVVTDTAYYACPTIMPATALPTVLPGTAIPIPPATSPPPTPYTITAPQDFYVGDAVFVGQPGAALYLRFRLQNVQIQPAQSQNLVTWRLEILNQGTMDYETIPVALMLITRITTASGDQHGMWYTSQAAMQAAGFNSENYDPLRPGLTRVYRLAAYIPAGHVRQFTYLLDGDGGNHLSWLNQTNPYCPGSVAN